MKILSKDQITFFNILQAVKELFVKAEDSTFTPEDREKLEGIETGAQKNVTSTVTETVALDEILSLEIKEGVIIKINKVV